MSHLTKGQEFIQNLEKEVKRLSPTLSLSMNGVDPYTQIMYIVRYAIDAILEEKRSLVNEYSRMNNESLHHSLTSDRGNDAKNKLADAQKELQRYEQLVRQKEKKVEEREKELENRLNSLKGADYSLEKEMGLMKLKNKELDGRIKALLDKDEELKQANEKLNKERSHFEGEKLAVFHMKTQTQQNYAESERLKEFSSTAYENIRKEKERISLEDKILKDREEALTLRQDYIEKSLRDLEKKKKLFEDEKSKFLQEKNSLKQIIEDKFNLSDKKPSSTFNYVDSRSQTLKSFPENSERTPTRDLDQLFDRLKGQIEIYNKEVEARERIFIDKQKQLRIDQEKLGIIARHLNSIKGEILIFHENLMCEFEAVLDKLSGQIELFRVKLVEIEKFQVKITESFFLKKSI